MRDSGGQNWFWDGRKRVRRREIANKRQATQQEQQGLRKATLYTPMTLTKAASFPGLSACVRKGRVVYSMLEVSRSVPVKVIMARPTGKHIPPMSAAMPGAVAARPESGAGGG